MESIEAENVAYVENPKTPRAICNFIKLRNTGRNDDLKGNEADEEQNMSQGHHDEESDVFQQVNDFEDDVVRQVDKESDVFPKLMMKVMTNIQLKNEVKQIPKIMIKFIKNFPGQVQEGATRNRIVKFLSYFEARNTGPPCTHIFRHGH